MRDFIGGSQPNFDFADGADSIVISGHKFIGSYSLWYCAGS